jgi:nicotinate phosphoribosyltransferase
VRIDSGDLIALSRTVREILDEGGLTSAIIFASGGIDEATLCACLRAGAPIDGFGIGTNLVTSADAPALDCAYKLQEYAGLPRRKRSTGKATWPGRKQFWRRYGSDGRMSGDILSIEDDLQVGEPMVKPVMRAGRRLFAKPTLAEIRAHASRQLARLPDPLRQLEAVSTYPVEIADALVRTASQVDQRLAARSSSDG